MTVEALLRALVAALRAESIPFMLTGSVAGAYHGAGRATMDIDLVIDPSREQLDSFVARMLNLGVYVSDDAAREALARRSMFNVVDPESGWKADLIVRKRRPFSEEEFRRRQPADFLDVSVDVATVEDLVLSKLEWAKRGGSARQLEDVRTLLRLAGTELDREYLARWIDELSLGAEWLAVTGPQR
jgi:hypothetical protein